MKTFALLGLSAGAAIATDPCNGVFSTQAACDAAAACTWCKSAAVPSACNTLANACDVKSESKLSEVTFYVKHQPARQAELLESFHAVSNPESPTYGRHLSHADVVALQTPLASDVAAVLAHVEASGGSVTKESIAGDKIVAKVPLASLDDRSHAVWASIDFVAGLNRTVRAAAPRRQRTTRSAAANPPAVRAGPQSCLAERAVPPCIRSAYGLGATVGGTANNSMAVIVNQAFHQTDLNGFCKEYKLTACDKAVATVGDNSGSAGDEASLDVQYISATGQGIPLTKVFINGHSADPFSDWMTWVSNTTAVPYVHSLSVGEPEGEYASDNGGVKIIMRMNSELAALGARGVSVIFASGDSGYVVEQKYPSSSPYVTSTGGVFNGELGDDVLQVDDIATGGFSSLDVNLIQPWQIKAVAAWEQTKGARPGKYNASHRCCPDLAIYDAGFYIIQDGSSTPVRRARSMDGATRASLLLVARVASHLCRRPLHSTPLAHSRSAAPPPPRRRLQA
jgi:tripeptidyl-peptidase-1